MATECYTLDVISAQTRMWELNFKRLINYRGWVVLVIHNKSNKEES